ncbi:ABC transporter ATP-binding protein [Paenibacillus sp. J5C_2022]|uniref:ABC transporter ATP-binding protein n=1 Tax=Paenibacillus sp. J5C2022 TaxID=2977129 RepID=UPI0021CE8F09|nr:ABC transporter ATP-binding protein [Paenibacillus sp. J5C2022]MCU6712930.1 ABC transporter ATP-binding protein [Paenibacillus sp. J5C2022]
MDQSANAIISASALKRTFGSGARTVTVLRHLSLSIAPGRLVALKGRSGSGKTTLINLLSGLDQPDAGEVWFDGELLTSMTGKQRDKVRRRKMGLVFQSFALLPLMSAYENVDFVLRVAGVPAEARATAALDALEQVGLSNRIHHRPYELSGGEQQRTAIARAIAHKPKLLLADEPTAELDSRTGLQMLRLFRQLIQSTGMTIVMSTHDPAIMDIVDDVYELEDGEIVDAR